MTALAELGQEVTTGTEVYAVDGEPVVALVGTTPSWRTLEEGVPDGSDVRTLERALVKLGFGQDITVDKHFTSATAEAVQEWEKSLGREDPDGTVDVGEIVLVSGAGQVVDHAVALGDAVPDGAQLLSLASNERVITVRVEADDIAAWSANATVSVRWADGGTVTGRIGAVGRDVTDGTVDVTVLPGKGTIDERTGTPAEVELLVRSSRAVVTVPVSALRDGPGGGRGRPSVTVVENGAATVRPVEIGLVAQGRVEVTSGLSAGEHVRLP